MDASDSWIDDAWRSYFGERCHPDVEGLVRAYPDRRSLHVDLVDLYGYDDEFTVALFDEPGRFLRRGVEVLCEGYDALEHANVRVSNNPALFELADLRARHLGELVTVEGVATSVGPVGATAAVAVFECRACGAGVEQRPYGVRLSPPGRCGECDGVETLAFRPEQSTYVDLRRVELSPPPEKREDGAAPRTVDLFLANDLADAVAAGDRFLATGIVRPVRVGPSNRFDLSIEGITVADERSPVPDRSLAEVIQSRWESMGEE